MLFNDSETINELICQKCNQTCASPSQLPCGHLLRTFCLKVTAYLSSTKNKCAVCQHNQLNKIVIAATNDKITDKLRNKASGTTKQTTTVFKLELDKIQAKLQQAEFELANGDYVIIEYCRDLKTDVQLAKELKIKELEDLSESIMSQIDTFQKADKAAFDLKLQEMKQTLL